MEDASVDRYEFEQSLEGHRLEEEGRGWRATEEVPGRGLMVSYQL